MSVRTRLALIYAALFLAGGTALLALTYGLVAASLPASNRQPIARPALTHAQYAELCKKPQSKKLPRRVPAAKVVSLCQHAYYAGRSAGAASERDKALKNLLVYSLAGLGLMTLASGGAGWLISGRVLRPVRVITATARRASEQHLGERIGLTGARDELKELADTFDAMLERLDRAFAAQRRFVADASHELRTPLTVMRTAIDVTLAKPNRSAEQLEAMADRIRSAIDRAERMIDGLLTLAVSDQGERRDEPVDLATAAEDALDATAAEIGRLGLTLTADLEPAMTTGDPRLLDRLIGTLIDNAVRHNYSGGTIAVASGVSEGRPFVRIANTGPRVPRAEVESLFQPFHRIDGRAGDGSGVGLGLAIAQSVAVAHGATLRAEPRAGGGLDVLVLMSGMPEWSGATA
jgi:signal transduction histidine kinase